MGWIVAAEVSGDFDRIDRTRLRDVRRQRVHEGRRVRLSGQGLRAGVWAEGVLHHPATGVVQGGPISPVWANIFLHQVLEAWCEHEVQPRLKGRSVLIRCADDFAAIPGERQDPITTALSRLPFRKHPCENTPLTGTL